MQFEETKYSVGQAVKLIPKDGFKTINFVWGDVLEIKEVILQKLEYKGYDVEVPLYRLINNNNPVVVITHGQEILANIGFKNMAPPPYSAFNQHEIRELTPVELAKWRMKDEV